MRTTSLLFAAVGGVWGRSIVQPQLPILADVSHEEAYGIPSVHESAVQARRILHLTTLGTLVSTLPASSAAGQSEDVSLQALPSDLAGNPIALMEYYADCEPLTGNPILLAVDIATPFRNYAAGSNISMAVRWWPERKTTYSFLSWLLAEDADEIPTPHTPAALPRFSLHGRLESLTATESAAVSACFTHAHPDSVLWQPGNEVSHKSHYVRFVVEHVYWFGGFGDRARIGWLPIEAWRNVTMDEIAECRLPGEQNDDAWWRLWL